MIENTVSSHDVDASLFYSGGTDSTASALLAKDIYRKVHLLTFDRGVGYGMATPGRPRTYADRLIARFGPDKFCHQIISIREPFRRIFADGFKAHLKEYGAHVMGLICPPCRIAMHAEGIIYNLENRIPVMIDGSTAEQAFEQSPEILQEYRKLDYEYGIQYSNPIYCAGDKDARQKLLYDNGVSEHAKFQYAMLGGTSDGLMFHRTQPTCVFSPFVGAYYRFLYHLFGNTEEQERRQEVEFAKSRMPYARAYINEHFEQKDVDVDKIVTEFKEINSHLQAIETKNL
jgi:hypothetical protein